MHEQEIADSDEFSNCEFCSYCVTINEDTENFCYFKCMVVHEVCENFKHFEGEDKPLPPTSAATSELAATKTKGA